MNKTQKTEHCFFFNKKEIRSNNKQKALKTRRNLRIQKKGFKNSNSKSTQTERNFKTN